VFAENFAVYALTVFFVKYIIAAGAATQNQYDPKSGKWDGNKITDPEKNNVGADYEFCGYLCCCPRTKVAIATPSREPAAVLTLADTLGTEDSITLPYSSDEMEVISDESFGGLAGRWSEGFGAGSLIYRIDWTPTSSDIVQTIFVTDEAVTLWRGSAVHIADPKHAIARRLNQHLPIVARRKSKGAVPMKSERPVELLAGMLETVDRTLLRDALTRLEVNEEGVETLECTGDLTETETYTSETSSNDAYEKARDGARAKAQAACTGKKCATGTCKYVENKLTGETKEVDVPVPNVPGSVKKTWVSTQTSSGVCACK
jgi:hypothetical protein